MHTNPRLWFAAPLGLAVAVTLAVPPVLQSQAADEPPPSFTASSLLPASMLSGPHHQVAEAVTTDSYFHQFSITSGFGSFEAIGRSQLAVRLQEIEALAALQEVSKTEVFLAAAGQSVVKIGKGAAAAVTDPAGTVKGIGAGVKRLGINLGRRGQRAVEGTDDKGTSPEGQKEGAPASATKGVLGVSSAARRWAQKVNVDPYTSNRVLKQALEDIAKVDAAGAIATKVAVPVPAPIGLTASVGDLVWSRDPEELRKLNEQRAKELGVADPVAKSFFRNAWVTLTYQTRLIAALHAVRVPGCEDYVQTAAEARSEREALFYVESAEALQRQHAQSPAAKVLPDSRTMVAATAAGRAVVLLPLDWIRATAQTTAVLRQIDTRARQELGAQGVEARLDGQFSPRAREVVASLGWSMAEGDGARTPAR